MTNESSVSSADYAHSPKENRAPASRKADQVYTRIREEIENGTLKPGQQLPESWLVEHTGASRTPVRDALRRLASDELVILKPRQAPTVSPLSLGHVRDLFSFRRVVEVAALEDIAQRSPTDELIRDDFAHLGDSFRNLEDEMDSELFGSKFRELTSLFDDKVVSHLRNQFLERSIVGLRPHTVRLRLIAHTDKQRLQQSIHEHIEMCEAVKAGDLRLASSAIRQHLVHVEKSILNSLITDSSSHVQEISF